MQTMTALITTTVLIGTNLTLDCTIPSSHTHLVQWTKNGFGLGLKSDLIHVHHFDDREPIPLFGFPRYVMQPNNSLVIHHVSYKDEGDYQCQTGQPLEMSEPVHVQVRYTPLKPILSHDVLLIDDQLAHFNCSSRGFPLPKITWWLNDYLLEEDYSVIKSTTVTSFITLLIDASIHHGSTLTCFSTNSLGRSRESVILETYAIPKITSTTTTISTRHKKVEVNHCSFLLPCRFSLYLWLYLLVHKNVDG